ncbi:MAG TPA: PAS domain S-box protein, partial [Nitrospirae bacterium]|nr:PAS domain S-box protein [Nitrospirota bacterium]
MLKVKFLRRIILASLTIAIVLPMYNIFFAYPSFIDELIDHTRYDATHTINHMISMHIINNPQFLKNEIIIDSAIINTFQEDRNLIKVKVFSAAGEIIYSSDDKNIGQINEKEYFREIVAKGGNYSQFVEKQTRSLEDELFDRDVVETYVPVMRDGSFLGAFEVYYDVTESKTSLDRLIFRSSSSLIAFSSGFILLIFIASFKATRNLADLKKKDSALQESEQRLKDISANSGEWVWEMDYDGKYTYTNPVVAEIMGYKPDEMLGKHFFDFYHPEDRGHIRHQAFEIFRMKEPFGEFISRNIHRDGEVVWLSTSGVTLLDKNGNNTGYRGAHINITDRKRFEKTIEQQITRLNALRSIEKAISSSLDLNDTLDI